MSVQLGMFEHVGLSTYHLSIIGEQVVFKVVLTLYLSLLPELFCGECGNCFIYGLRFVVGDSFMSGVKRNHIATVGESKS